jgi:hypothetical protein
LLSADAWVRPAIGPHEILIRVHSTAVTQGDRRLRAADFPGHRRENVPSLIGAPLSTWVFFQPDASLAFVASAVMGVLWAVFRLGVAFTGRAAPA